jgi:hypothetical protein
VPVTLCSVTTAELRSRDDDLVGRRAELARLERELGDVRGGRPRIVLVDGPAGIGKTALLRRFLGDSSGLRVLWVGCEEAEACPVHGVAGQVARLAGVPVPDALTGLGVPGDRVEDPHRRAERVLTAAQANLDAGSAAAASALLDAADEGLLDELGRARLERMRARIAFVTRRGRDAPPLLLRAARRLEPLDVRRARETYLEALDAAMFAGSLGGGCGVLEVAEAARAAPPAPEPQQASDPLLDGLAALHTEGYAAGVPTLKRALGAVLDGNDLRWLQPAARTARELWDHEAWLTLATRWVQFARDTGALTQLPLALTHLTGATVLTGDLAATQALIEEARSIATATGSPPPSYAEVYVAAWRGDEQAHAALVEKTLEDAEARGEGNAITVTEYTTAILHNGLGNHRTALAAAQRSYANGEVILWAIPEVVEAAARSGRPELARPPLQRLSELAQCSGTELALGLRACSLALVAEGPDAEELFAEALDRLSRTRATPHLARAHLLYGEWLRGERRRLDAREQLRTAHEMFKSMGAEAFAGRAARELLATGERAPKPRVETRSRLTAQEAHIARLANEGLSNPEIGARLFLSPAPSSITSTRPSPSSASARAPSLGGLSPTSKRTR